LLLPVPYIGGPDSIRLANIFYFLSPSFKILGTKSPKGILSCELKDSLL
jgi:hypothetical protein